MEDGSRPSDTCSCQNDVIKSKWWSKFSHKSSRLPSNSNCIVLKTIFVQFTFCFTISGLVVCFSYFFRVVQGIVNCPSKYASAKKGHFFYSSINLSHAFCSSRLTCQTVHLPTHYKPVFFFLILPSLVSNFSCAALLCSYFFPCCARYWNCKLPK